MLPPGSAIQAPAPQSYAVDRVRAPALFNRAL